MLSAAAALNSVEKVEEILKKPNVRVDEKDGEGCTPLWIAAQNGFVGVAQALIKAGAIVDAINLQGESPLYAACRKGHIDMARVLLRNGAMIDYPARSNATPLITAALHGHVQVVMFLVDEGADLDAATQNGITAEEIAKETGHSVIHKYLKFQKECLDRKRERDCQWVICSADHYNQPEPTWDIHISDEPDSNLDSASFNANPSNLTAHLSTQRNTFVAHPPSLFPTSPGMEPTAVSPAYDDDSLLVGVLNNEGGNPFSPSTTTTSPPTQLNSLASPAATSSPLTAPNGVLRVPSTAATGSSASPTTGADGLRSRNRSDLGGITYDVDPQSLFTELVRLDAGASGEVYRGVRRSDGQTFAIKKIPFSSDNDLRELQQEIHMMRRACSASQTVHTNVVRFYDAHQWEKNMWIVMEFMSGGKLTDLITSSIKLYIDEGVIAYFCLEILKGLQYLHDRCIIHRDIKSDNVLVGHDGSVKLGDFGLSAIVDKEERRTTVLGTPFWMAPEVISGDKDHPYDERADIWSLGILAVELADGQPPYINEPPVKALMRIVQQPAPRIRTESHWSEEMRDFIYGMLQKDPAKRPSAKQMREHHFLRKACGPEKIGKLVEKRRKKDVKK